MAAAQVRGNEVQVTQEVQRENGQSSSGTGEGDIDGTGYLIDRQRKGECIAMLGSVPGQ